jgi:hypothetical protein
MNNAAEWILMEKRFLFAIFFWRWPADFSATKKGVTVLRLVYLVD